MRKIVSLLISFFIIFYNHLFSQNYDSLKTFELPSIEIISRRGIPFVEIHKYGTDYNSNLLNQNGYTLIRRGINFTQDLYVEGFKKGDIKVLIDGEHYHNACPNRMDAPATRVNIIDMESVELTKSSSLIGTGVYGKVEYHRSSLSDVFKFKSLVNGSAGYKKDFDFAVAGEGLNSSITFRISQGIPYLNGEGKSFKELYNYKDNGKFSYYNTSFRHKLNNFDLEIGSNFTFANNISFPYLQMDEKLSKSYNIYLKYKTNKIYLNYTDHLMNNDLRNSSMFMETRAKNLTIGLNGKFYEVYYRNWNADNVIRMMSNSIYNKLMPNVDQIGLNLSENFSFEFVKVFLKGGLQYLTFKDEARKTFYEELYSNVSSKRYFISSGVTFVYSPKIHSNLTGKIITEFSSDSPDPELLFIAVKRMGNNPDWSGNPNLRQPVKFGARGTLDYKNISFEIFTNYILNYIDVVKKMKTNKPVMTYENVNSLLMGSNLHLRYRFFETNISYLWGENTKTKKPLAEIAPLSMNSSLYLPVFSNFDIIVYHQYENAQKRINKDLNEFSSATWNTIGLGLNYTYKDFNFDLRINNLLNHNYYRFLSFSRNPFSTNRPVYDPGRNVTLTIFMSKIF